MGPEEDALEYVRAADANARFVRQPKFLIIDGVFTPLEPGYCKLCGYHETEGYNEKCPNAKPVPVA